MVYPFASKKATKQHDNDKKFLIKKAKEQFMPAQYKIEASRDYFTEAQPETTTPEVWQIIISDAQTDEMIDSDTGYSTEADALASGNAWLAVHDA